MTTPKDDPPKEVASPKPVHSVPGKKTAVDFDFHEVIGKGAFGEVNK